MVYSRSYVVLCLFFLSFKAFTVRLTVFYNLVADPWHLLEINVFALHAIYMDVCIVCEKL